MTRIDELKNKYPTLPKDFILQMDALVRGIRDTEDLDKISNWGAFMASYQSYDHDVTLKERAERRPTIAKDGKILRPMAFLTKRGLAAGVEINTKSTYEIREVGAGKFALFDGEERVDEDIYFPPPPRPQANTPLVTSRGTPVWTLVKSPQHYSEVCAFILPVRHCEYFSTGDQCKFCNFNATQDDARTVGMKIPVVSALQDTLEAYKIRSSVVRLYDVRWEMGGFLKETDEEKIYFNFMGELAKAAPYKPNFTTHTEAMSKKNMQRLKDQGLDCMTLQIETLDPELFPETCPGKAKHAPYERWVEALLHAVDVFGVGNVGCSMIGGLTMIPPNGHKTWQEGRDSLIEGARSMIKKGVMVEHANLRLPPGSVYGADPINREKIPPTEYFLEAAKANYEACVEYGLAYKVNRFMYCGLDACGHRYEGQLAWLDYGDVGKWFGDAIPEKANWLAKFISSVNSSATVK